MIDAPIAIDQEGYHTLVAEAIQYLDYTGQRLMQAYEELQAQEVDTTDLGAATEALLFSADKLREQKLKLESYREKLQLNITSQYDQKGGK